METPVKYQFQIIVNLSIWGSGNLYLRRNSTSDCIFDRDHDFVSQDSPYQLRRCSFSILNPVASSNFCYFKTPWRFLKRLDDFWNALTPSVLVWRRFNSSLRVFLGKSTSRNTMEQLFPHWDHYFLLTSNRPKADNLIFVKISFKFPKILAKFSSPLHPPPVLNFGPQRF